jgi:hypothetical protein
MPFRKTPPVLILFLFIFAVFFLGVVGGTLIGGYLE